MANITHNNTSLQLRLAKLIDFQIRHSASCPFVPAGELLSPAAKEALANTLSLALDTFKSLAPRDALEQILIAQMVVTHTHLMECYNRAGKFGEEVAEPRRLNLQYADRYGRLFLDQMKALTNYRGQGDQTMVVGNIHVESGANAVVGNIKTSPKAQQESPTGKMISKQSEPALNVAFSTDGAAAPIDVQN